MRRVHFTQELSGLQKLHSLSFLGVISYLRRALHKSRKNVYRFFFTQRFYMHHFHVVPNVQSDLNPQVHWEMSQNLLLLQHYQSNSLRMQAFLWTFFFTANLDSLFFTACSFKVFQAGTRRCGISFSAVQTATRGSAAQMTHKRLKI